MIQRVATGETTAHGTVGVDVYGTVDRITCVDYVCVAVRRGHVGVCWLLTGLRVSSAGILRSVCACSQAEVLHTMEAGTALCNESPLNVWLPLSKESTLSGRV